MAWRESLHPRDRHGRFSDTGSGGGWLTAVSDQIEAKTRTTKNWAPGRPSKTSKIRDLMIGSLIMVEGRPVEVQYVGPDASGNGTGWKIRWMSQGTAPGGFDEHGYLRNLDPNGTIEAAPRRPAHQWDQPPQGEDSKRMARWRVEAQKPARKQTTRREQLIQEAQTYLRSWEAGVRTAERDLARAQSDDNTAGIVGAQNDIRYNQRGADRRLADIERLKTDPDPFLDEIVPIPGVLLLNPNPKRPMAIYGDMLHLGGGQYVHDAMLRLETIPFQFHATVAEHMAKHEKGGIWLAGHRPVSDMDHSQDLKAEQPRGWAKGDTFDDVNGVYRPGWRILLIGFTTNTFGRGTQTAAHEFGHAFDDALGTPSKEQHWQIIHKAVVTHAGPGLSPYYRQLRGAGAEEYWADAFATWSGIISHNRYARVSTLMGVYDIDSTSAEMVVDYFDNLAKARGVKIG